MMKGACCLSNRQVTLFEELVLLKEYEKSEDVLAEKVSTKQQEKLDMQNKVSKRNWVSQRSWTCRTRSVRETGSVREAGHAEQGQ